MINAASIRQKLADLGGITFPTGWTLHATTQRLDEIGGRFTEFRFQYSAGSPLAELSQRASQIAKRVTGLLEPLRLIEIDSDVSIGQLRSSQPIMIDDGLQYDELLIRPTEMILNRYRVQNRQPREVVPFTLTYEALAKMADDLTKS